MKVFENYAYYYNLFYENKDYNKEALYIHDLIKKYNKGSKRILDLGCGTGKHAAELNKFGFEVHGVDISENMIRQALKNQIEDTLTFQVADIRGYKTNKKYDIVTSLFHVMSYQCSNKDLEAAFRTAHKHLDMGGLFIFDCWYGPGVLTEHPEVRIKRIENEKYYIVRIAEPNMNAEENIVDVNYQVLVTEKKTGITKEIRETHRMRYLFKPEVQYILEKVGFQLLEGVEFGNGKKLSYSSWNACFVGVKR